MNISRIMVGALVATFLSVVWVTPASLAQSPAANPSAQPTAQPQQLLSEGELDALVSPIALYPDALLAEILKASTYPLELVEAERWANANKNLKGDALKAVTERQSWDDSVKSLVATPAVLDMMSGKLDWTQKLGDAVLAQQADVMDAIQRLRQRAQANKKLVSTKQQTVTTQEQGGRQIIAIAPTDPGTVYVPYYDPAVIYGDWPYPAYPPYYFGAPGYIAGGVIAAGVAFGTGYVIGRWVANGGRWGGGFNWGGRQITHFGSVNNVNISNNWVHNSAHRQGVRYRNADVAAKYGGNRGQRGDASTRLDFRGKSGQQVLQPGAGNKALANRTPGNQPGVGNRPAADRTPANRPAAKDRASAKRPTANRPAANRAVSRPARTSAFGNVGPARSANVQAARGRASFGGGGGGSRGGGGGFRGGGGGRRSDARLKHDAVFLGRLDNSLGFYRFIYNGGQKAYVGVLAQEVQAIMPEAVRRGRDGYLRVSYGALGVKFQSYDDWIASGARLPAISRIPR